jgi:hypothetical protein
MWTIVWKTETGYHAAAGEEFRNWDAALMYARAKLKPNNPTDATCMEYHLPYWVILPSSKAYDLIHGVAA